MITHAYERNIKEMREFATFSPKAQRYIKRALDVANYNKDTYKRWCRDEEEELSIEIHFSVYKMIDTVIDLIPDNTDTQFEVTTDFFGNLTCVAIFDISQYGIDSFDSFRFLYERLFGSKVHPYLPAVFVAAATLPVHIVDKRIYLLQSLPIEVVQTTRWSETEPLFFPTWILDKSVEDFVD
jgi:hypothetical protein